MRVVDEMKTFIIWSIVLALSHHIKADKHAEFQCKNVACPTPDPCPSDSILKEVKHHSSFQTTQRSHIGELIRRERAIAYGGRQRESIKIIPGAYDHHSRKRSIDENELLILHCCPRYECACKPNYCDQECPPNKIPVNLTGPTDHTDLQYGIPGNCCMPCKNNYCIQDAYRKHGAKWSVDECTTCECLYGEIKCQQSFCQPPDCLNYKQIPGECCPVCDYNATHFCEEFRNCNIRCQFGYRRKGDCDLCACENSPLGSTLNVIGTPIAKGNETMKEYDNTTGSVHKDHDMGHPHLGKNIFNIYYWLVVCFLALAAIVVACGLLALFLRVWSCHNCRSITCKKSSKYSTVQIA